MRDEYISVKEFAKRAGVSVQSLYKRLNGLNSPLNQYVVDNQKMLNISALEEVYGIEVEQPIQPNHSTYSTFHSTPEQENKSKTENRKTVCEKTESLQLVFDLVSSLKEQLEEKDRQLAEKDKQIESLQKALVLAQENIKGAQLLQANAEQKLLEQKDESKSEVLEKGKGFWAKFLGK